MVPEDWGRPAPAQWSTFLPVSFSSLSGSSLLGVKRFALTLALCCGALSPLTLAQTAAPATPPAAAERTIEAITATSQKGYSIRVPAGWTPFRNVPGADVAFVSKTLGTIRPTVTVVVNDVPADLKVTLADVRDINVKNLTSLSKEALKIVGEKTIKVSGRDAILWTLVGNGEGGQVRWTQVFTVKNNRIFTATLITPVGAPGELLESGRAILTSLTLK